MCLNERFLHASQSKASAERFSDSLSTLKKWKYFAFSYLLQLCRWQGGSKTSNQRCPPSEQNQRRALTAWSVTVVSQCRVNADKKHHPQHREERTLRTWVVFNWSLLPTLAESFSLASHDGATDSSNDSLTWLLFKSFDFQLFSRLQRPEQEIFTHPPTPCTAPQRVLLWEELTNKTAEFFFFPFTSSQVFQLIPALFPD